MDYEITNNQFPLLKFDMNPNEEIRIQRGSMIYHSPSIRLDFGLNGHGRGLMKFANAIGRSMATGESSLITKAIASDYGEIALAPPMPGDIQDLRVDPDNEYCINDGAFLAMAGADYNVHTQNLKHSLIGNLSGTGGIFIMETAGTGTFFVNSYGSICVLDLNDEEMTIDNQHVVAWSNTLDYDLHFDSGIVRSWGNGEGLVNTFSGTGSIIIQTLNLQTFANNLIPFLPGKNNN